MTRKIAALIAGDTGSGEFAKHCLAPASAQAPCRAGVSEMASERNEMMAGP